MNLKNLKINFLGDSITEGCGTSDISKVYWNLLAERDGVVARGYGIGGTRILGPLYGEGLPRIC